ncbi:Gar1/Naf1 family protein [Thermococcus barophilus]|uniref:Gar1-like small nucleolar rnp n=1 Tax=Thermococcus barophilus (strain DSM 11836 / MP) TaxID=391623 RepID=F0LLM2_THEBM|nr:Gar1/Naf1 family protein [Thermococcus barophilus]ADT83799.1 gar1-like small nucleolar rnp [Thermococcus barophilus MP]
MKRLGRVSHYAKQGFLILRSNWIPSLNDPVVDKDLQLVGIVKDVFGPVKMPYIAVKPKVKAPEKYVGQVLYIDERKRKKETQKKKGKKFKRKRPAPRRRG